MLDGRPLRATDANPLASLFARLTKDAPLDHALAGEPPHEIAVGDTRLVVHASYAAFQASAGAGPGSS